MNSPHRKSEKKPSSEKSDCEKFVSKKIQVEKSHSNESDINKSVQKTGTNSPMATTLWQNRDTKKFTDDKFFCKTLMIK